MSSEKDTRVPSTSRAREVPITPPRRRAHPALPVRPLLVGAAWAATAILGLIAVGRLVHLDDAIEWPYSGINAFTPLVYLPAYASLAVAFAFRRNLLMIVSGLLVVVHLFWTVPEILPGDTEAAPPESARLRVMSANLLYHNDRAGRIGEQIRAENPDVLVLVEVSPLTLDAVRSSGALSGYHYSEVRPEEGAFGSAVFSRFPLSNAYAPEVAGQASLRVTVELDEGRRFVMYAVHTVSPTQSDFTDRWRTQLDTLRRENEESDLPMIMAGDFNATRDHRPFRRLTSSGMRDAHDVIGAGWTPTWNANTLVLPPTLRIDHVLASPTFAVTGYRVGSEFGSDHKPVTVDLAMR